jgi:hypothetical protein
MGIAAAITGLAALLQWIWAGWSVYSGPGPSLALRWLLTEAVGAALLLPPAAAIGGAAVGRRIADTGLREQLRVTQRGPRQLARLVGRWALAPLLLATLFSAAGWGAISLVERGRSADGGGLPGLLAIGGAHALVLVMGAAFALWGLAVGAAPESRVVSPGVRRVWLPRSIARSGVWGLAVMTALVAGPALVGPLLPHLTRPERALDAVLLVNPVTAVGAALGMDLLRSPHVYGLTRASEYWYTYPSLTATAGVYLTAAALGAQYLKRQLERE